MKKCSSLILCLLLFVTMLPVGWNLQASGSEALQVLSPTAAGGASGSSFFPMDRAFDGQPTLDQNSGEPVGGSGTYDAPAYRERVGYIDFGEDWSKVKITSTWTQYRPSSVGNQIPYETLWWDDDTDTTNDSGLTESGINFNSAQNLSTGSTTPWILDSDVSGSPITPQARYLLALSPDDMTSRATEYAIIGWIDENGNGVQDSDIPVTGITVSGAGGATSLYVNSTLQMSADVTPTNASDPSVTWTVLDGNVSATISPSGLLTAVSGGTVTVKATAQDGSGVFGTQVVSIYDQDEANTIISPSAAGVATGSQFFPLERAFDGQPVLDANNGEPIGGDGPYDAPSYGERVGYIDFGTDWDKVRITSTWTQYRTSSAGSQIPFETLWWDDDTDTTNDSGLTESGINFNSAHNLSTGTTTPWIMDRSVSGSALIPQARYLLLRSPAGMTNRAKEFAFSGWIDQNGNGVQDAPPILATGVTVSGEGGAIAVLLNGTLQMSAEVAPAHATDKSVAWSVQDGTGSATISSSGLLTGVSEGKVMVKATAQDGTNVFGTVEITVADEILNTFLLPTQSTGNLHYPDLQSAFPQVDWETLDRLYIPAGVYGLMKLGNLPDRSANHPLIITNYGGQVKIASTYTYTVSMEGGSHWVLTGEYDPENQTGHIDYKGHQDGNYANSEGNYGIEIARSNSSGIAVGNGATNFELSYIEIAHAGFAGLLIKTDHNPTATMDGVKIHDLYIHDAESEGMYLGNTSSNIDSQHLFTNLEIYNNRVLRSGTEGIQLGHMGDGVNVHHNVIVMSAVDWKDPFQPWQDNALQYGQRTGSADIHHNIIIGGASKLFDVRFYAASTDTLNPNDEVRMYNNYFSHGRNNLAYIHSTTSNTVTKFHFYDNIIREMNYSYDELPGTQTDLGIMFFAANNTNNPLTFTDNIHDGSRLFIDTINGNNGTSGNVTATGNTTTTVDPVVFEDVTFPADFDWSKVEVWDDYSNLYSGTIYYEYGDYVYYYPTGELYKNIEPGIHTGKNPTTHPATWELQSPMEEDFRLDPASPYQGFGLLE